jgi:mono/diheme cytochrome c family protein
MLFWAPPPPPVSYSAEIAPIFAMHCSSCHGTAGGLSTRSWKELMQGGHLGKVVIPGDPDRSLLLHFIDGRRGAEQRMPIGGSPLNRDRIQTIARWIAEGAADDVDTTPRHVRTVPNIRAGKQKLLRIKATVDAQSYLILTVRDPRTGHSLLTEVASVKTPREENDSASPGEPFVWEVRTERSWPEVLAVELVVKYAARNADPQLSIDVENAQ